MQHQQDYQHLSNDDIFQDLLDELAQSPPPMVPANEEPDSKFTVFQMGYQNQQLQRYRALRGNTNGQAPLPPNGGLQQQQARPYQPAFNFTAYQDYARVPEVSQNFMNMPAASHMSQAQIGQPIGPIVEWHTDEIGTNLADPGIDEFKPVEEAQPFGVFGQDFDAEYWRSGLNIRLSPGRVYELEDDAEEPHSEDDGDEVSDRESEVSNDDENVAALNEVQAYADSEEVKHLEQWLDNQIEEENSPSIEKPLPTNPNDLPVEEDIWGTFGQQAAIDAFAENYDAGAYDQPNVEEISGPAAEVPQPIYDQPHPALAMPSAQFPAIVEELEDADISFNVGGDGFFVEDLNDQQNFFSGNQANQVPLLPQVNVPQPSEGKGKKRKADGPVEDVDDDSDDANVRTVAPTVKRHKKGPKEPKKPGRYNALKADVNGTLPDYSNTVLNFNTREEALGDLYSRLYDENEGWNPPEEDDTVPETDMERRGAARIILGALMDTSRAQDADSRGFKSRWAPNAARPYEYGDLETAAWEVVSLAERLHLEGPTVLEIRDANYVENINFSSHLTFEQRIKILAKLVMEWKARADGLIKGDTLHTAVGAPLEALSSARSNYGANKERNKALKWAKDHKDGPKSKVALKKRKRAAVVPSDLDSDSEDEDVAPKNGESSRAGAHREQKNRPKAQPRSRRQPSKQAKSQVQWESDDEDTELSEEDSPKPSKRARKD